MRASELKHRITIRGYTTQQDPSNGEITTEWADIATIYAAIKPLSVKDKITAQAAGSEIAIRCVIRYRDDITSAMQIVHRGITYEIDGDPLPDPDTGREYLTLTLKRINHGR